MKRLPYRRPTSIRRRRTKHSAQRLDAPGEFLHLRDMRFNMPHIRTKRGGDETTILSLTWVELHSLHLHPIWSSHIRYFMRSDHVNSPQKLPIPLPGIRFYFPPHLCQHARHTVQSGMRWSTESDRPYSEGWMWVHATENERSSWHSFRPDRLSLY